MIVYINKFMEAEVSTGRALVHCFVLFGFQEISLFIHSCHIKYVSGVIFNIETYDDYLFALENSKTEMFWANTYNIDTSNFDFDIYFTHDDVHNRHENHAFIHRVDDKDYYNGLFLLSKCKIL